MATRPLINPNELPILRVDGHLPAPASHALTAEALRNRFLAQPVWSPELALEPLFAARQPTPASVLIPLVDRGEGGGLQVLLTRRTDHLNDHPGQISFPGGRAEPSDADAAATALREAQEEIGLAPDFVDVLGTLPLYTTGTGFVVTPVVGLIGPGFGIVADPFEVAEVFEVPLSFLLDPGQHRWHTVDFDGVTRRFLSMLWRPEAPHGVEARDYVIWGATAAMLRNFYRFVCV